MVCVFFLLPGSEGVPDMTVISDIDEDGINKNLRARYSKDLVYVSFSNLRVYLETLGYVGNEEMGIGCLGWYITLSHEGELFCIKLFIYMIFGMKA